jgi:hypothetical protein
MNDIRDIARLTGLKIRFEGKEIIKPPASQEKS